MRFLLRVLVLLMLCGPVLARPPVIQTTGNGLYHQALDGALAYKVDTVTRLCFVAFIMNGSLAPVPCGRLARRDEWKPIITWHIRSNTH